MDTWYWGHHKAQSIVRQRMGVRIRNTFSDNDRDELDSHNLPEITMRHDLANDETCIIPGTLQVGSPVTFPTTDWLCDGKNTDHNMEPDAEASLEQPKSTSANPRCRKYQLRHNHTPNCKDDYRE